MRNLAILLFCLSVLLTDPAMADSLSTHASIGTGLGFCIDNISGNSIALPITATGTNSATAHAPVNGCMSPSLLFLFGNSFVTATAAVGTASVSAQAGVSVEGSGKALFDFEVPNFASSGALDAIFKLTLSGSCGFDPSVISGCSGDLIASATAVLGLDGQSVTEPQLQADLQSFGLGGPRSFSITRDYVLHVEGLAPGQMVAISGEVDAALLEVETFGNFSATLSLESIQAAPEPASLVLLLTMLGGMPLMRYISRRSSQ